MRVLKGFTLIELMVVIAIIAILVVVAVPSYNEYNKNQRLNEAANQLQATLRQAQNNAQTGTQCNPNTASASKAEYWYIQLPYNGTERNTSYYTLEPVCESGTQIFPSSLLPSEVVISNISIGGCDISNTEIVKARFSNVNTNVTFEGSTGCPDGINSSMEITLENSSSSKTIIVEKGGGIYVKN
jgi:type II secretion system protein H